MKKVIKRILGRKWSNKMANWKMRFFPNEEQRAMKATENENHLKRILFYSGLVKPGDLCFDVGANVGNRVKSLLAIGARVVAIEPNLECVEILKKEFGSRIQMVPKGLGESNGEKVFYSSDSSTISSFSLEWIDSVKRGRFKDYHWDAGRQVSITTLDQLIEKYGKPTFVKIDVEGYELNVLKGLSQPIDLISFEYTVPELTNRVLDHIRQLESIDEHYQFNYCIGERMQFELNTWVCAADFSKFVMSDEFIGSGFGDIYEKTRAKSGAI